MGRKVTEGLEYFPLDVDFWDDPKILLVEEKFGLKGSSIAARLLCWIYRNGYYIDWNQNMALVFAKRVGNNVTCALVSEVVNELVNLSFFHKGLFERFAILTSNGIQKRWVEIITLSKRKAKLKEEFKINSLIDGISSEENAGNKELMSLILDGSTQSKVKESKGNSETPPKLICEFKEEHINPSLNENEKKVMVAAVRIFGWFKKMHPQNLDLDRYTLLEWIKPIRELMQGKKYTLDQIKEIMEFMVESEDTFWKDTVLNTEKLTKHFETIKIKNLSKKKAA